MNPNQTNTNPTNANQTNPKEKKADSPLAWELLQTTHLAQDEWIDFRRLSYRFPDGSVFEPFYNYSLRDYVVIVATDEAGDYLCVRQFRQGVGEVTTELPAGGIEGTGKTGVNPPGQEMREPEDPLDAAKRELREETGHTSEEWEFLLKIPSYATMADNYAYIFRARNCREVTGQDLDETEFLNVEKHSREEIWELLQAGGFQQAVHAMAYLYAQLADRADADGG